MARIGIVAVHGVIPQARYGFQDQVATELRTALNRFPGISGPWETSVVFPGPLPSGSPTSAPDLNNTPTISRVHRRREAPNAPTSDFFDVHEAYWSPIDKGKTAGARVLQWLLTTIFLPINNTARYTERFLKVCWDIGYVLLAILLGAACFVACIMAATWALGAGQFLGSQIPAPMTVFSLVVAPLTLINKLSFAVAASLTAGVLGGYLAGQTIRAAWSLVHNLSALTQTDPVQLTSRILAIVVLGAASFVCLRYCITGRIWPLHVRGAALEWPGFALALSVLLFQTGRALALWFIVNFFGDVQIYTTRNENSDFFSLREEILDLVTRTILHVGDSAPTGQPYDRIYIMAHSLGSTIAMDALMRIYNAKKSTPAVQAIWDRIRGFITFGTSLEKTKYFFNAWSPTQSQTYQQWQADLYGGLFTADPSALVPTTQTFGIYWLNCWYFSDFVSDRISSYRSFVLPGHAPSTRRVNRILGARHARARGLAVAGRLLADNRSRFGDFAPWRFHVVTHGDYLPDQVWFWEAPPNSPKRMGAIDVLTSGIEGVTPQEDLHVLRQQPTMPVPYEAKPLSRAVEFLTPDVIKPSDDTSDDVLDDGD